MPPDWLADPVWLKRLLLVDSWAGVWLALFGLAAQAVFMSRMLVQWIASERARRSVVPAQSLADPGRGPRPRAGLRAARSGPHPLRALPAPCAGGRAAGGRFGPDHLVSSSLP